MRPTSGKSWVGSLEKEEVKMLLKKLKKCCCGAEPRGSVGRFLRRGHLPQTAEEREKHLERVRREKALAR
jgi:ribosome maturation protein Sdo1